MFLPDDPLFVSSAKKGAQISQLLLVCCHKIGLTVVERVVQKATLYGSIKTPIPLIKRPF